MTSRGRDRGSHQLRAFAMVYAQANASESFAKDLLAAWVKVMELDCYDLHT